MGNYSQHLEDVHLEPAVRVREEGVGATQEWTLSVPAVAYRMLLSWHIPSTVHGLSMYRSMPRGYMAP